MSEQGNYNVLVEVKKTTIWLRKKDAEKSIDGRIKNQGVIMIENKIILIEDDKEIRGMINDYLSGEFEVTAFNDGMSAIQKITSYDEYALALIDLMLPDISGMEIIKIIRKVSKIPIIIITAKDNDIDKSLGLNLGADDYVVKPFSIKELMARVNVILMRHEPREEKTQGEIYEFQGLTVNISAREVFVDGVHVELRPKEYDLLFFLVRNRGIVFSRDALLEKVWGFDFMGDDRTVDAQIKMLRHVLGDYRTYIVTYRGAGYKFEAEEKA